jgi:hypothetical protein
MISKPENRQQGVTLFLRSPLMGDKLKNLQRAIEFVEKTE